jgi:hypothetical protein
LHYLSGSITFDPVVNKVDALAASQIVWLDCLLTNVDRTARNTNMLVWNKELWLIDHGASLYFHHSWGGPVGQQALRPFVQVKDHVLLPWASRLPEVDAAFRELLTTERISAIVELVPEEWLVNYPGAAATEEPAAIRGIYKEFLTTRVASSSVFINEALHARQAFI